MKYKVGDRVKVVYDAYPSLLHMTGTVAVIQSAGYHDNDPLIGVSFDMPMGGHNLDGRCEDDFGWWLKSYMLEHCSNNRNPEDLFRIFEEGENCEDV